MMFFRFQLLPHLPRGHLCAMIVAIDLPQSRYGQNLLAVLGFWLQIFNMILGVGLSTGVRRHQKLLRAPWNHNGNAILHKVEFIAVDRLIHLYSRRPLRQSNFCGALRALLLARTRWSGYRGQPKWSRSLSRDSSGSYLPSPRLQAYRGSHLLYYIRGGASTLDDMVFS